MDASDPMAERWLEAFLDRHRGVAGTVHRDRGGELHLVASRNLPPVVKAAVMVVARGKGMAGEAQVRRTPFQTCNLRSDPDERIRPGARTVDGRSAVALPVIDAKGEVVAVVGISFSTEGELPMEVVAHLLADAATLPPPAGKSR